ncbi:MAG TPA: hypothetical protein PKC60_13585 [Hydrogenophaga sp.]|uniref:hypothetical protein n=1 Tax=Hydrogenophaga sp. TaxID=1904254 RepID=UPI002C970817|nr:hypothetical protein [Hydrogenophaga sp.]HMN94257.1 hypothetical protein [Hydrogenophaga sp.]
MPRLVHRLKSAAPIRMLAGTATLLAMLACGDTLPPPAEPIATPLNASGQLPQLERLPMVEGIDADGDGVRDDIADHIRKTYTDPVQYRAAMQVARAYQSQLLVDKHDHIALQAASEQMMRAIACVNRHAFAGDGGERQSLRLMDELEAMTTNTKERLQAYLAYNKARSGSVSVRAEGDVCE